MSKPTLLFQPPPPPTSTTWTPYTHRADIPAVPDDGEPVTFKWHWPRGTFARVMSAAELAVFLLPHMPSVAGFFSGHPRVHAEFLALLHKCLSIKVCPKSGRKEWVVSAPDEVVPWIQTAYRTEADDIVVLGFGNRDTPKRPTYFLLGH